MEQRASENLIISLSAWFHTPPGSYARTWEQERLDELTADIFGYNAVQLGMPQMDTLAANRMPNRWITDSVFSNDWECKHEDSNEAEQRRVVLVHDYAELPFASQSLDLVVLPHVL